MSRIWATVRLEDGAIKVTVACSTKFREVQATGTVSVGEGDKEVATIKNALEALVARYWEAAQEEATIGAVKGYQPLAPGVQAISVGGEIGISGETKSNVNGEGR